MAEGGGADWKREGGLEGSAYDGNRWKPGYLSTNLVGSLLLQIRGEGYDDGTQGARRGAEI